MRGSEECANLGLGDIAVHYAQSVCGKNRRELVQRLPVALPDLPDHSDAKVQSGRREQTDRRSQLGVTLVRAHHPEDQQANRLTWSWRVLGRKTAALAGIGGREGCE